MGFLDLSVLELGRGTRQTDRQTDVPQRSRSPVRRFSTWAKVPISGENGFSGAETRDFVYSDHCTAAYCIVTDESESELESRANLYGWVGRAHRGQVQYVKQRAKKVENRYPVVELEGRYNEVDCACSGACADDVTTASDHVSSTNVFILAPPPPDSLHFARLVASVQIPTHSLIEMWVQYKYLFALSASRLS